MEPASFLKTKLEIPPIQGKVITRSHLNNLLDKSIACRLTTVCAPAGYGKTTSLIEWTRRTKFAVAWFSIDEGDDDSHRFWYYVAMGLNKLDDHIGRSALSSLKSDKISVETAISGLLNEITALDKPTILILDDYHLIQNESIHHQMLYWLNRLPKQLHIIIAARNLIHLPVSRLHVQGHVMEIGVNDLCFHRSETARFFDGLKSMSPSQEHISHLTEITEGWIAGIHMVSQIVAKKNEIENTSFSIDGGHRQISDFLIEEVFNRQTEDIQTFLLLTSILDQMCGALCNFVTGESSSDLILEQLEATGQFVFSLDENRQWFRYHRLIREMLSHRLTKTEPEIVTRLHRQASEWFEQHGYHSYAIQHALGAGDYNLAAELLDANSVDLIIRGETSTIGSWLSVIPEELVRSKPGICVAHAISTLLNPTADAFDIIEKRLIEAENAINTNAFYKTRQSFRNKINKTIAGLRANVARERGDSSQGIINISKKALLDTSNDDKLWRSTIAMNLAMAYRAVGNASAASKAISDNISPGDVTDRIHFSFVYSKYLLAQTKFIQGYIQEASDICRNVLIKYETQYQKDNKTLPVLGALYVCRGMILLEKNQLERAEKPLKKGIALLKALNDLDSLLSGYTALIKLKIARQTDFTEVNRLISEMEQLGLEASKYGSVLRINHIWSKAETNTDCISATALLVQKHGFKLEDDAAPPGIDHIGQRQYEQQLAVIRFLISQHFVSTGKQKQPDLVRVMKILDGKLVLARERGLTMRVIQILILQGLAHQACEKAEPAMDSLKDALALAEQSGFFRIFLDEGSPMIGLLRTAVSRGIHPDYATRLLKACIIHKKGPEWNASATEEHSMSDRELQVLRLITAGLSNREIAEELFIAVGTVKKHLDNIYGKLDVHKRTQAIAKAQELAIL